MSTDLLNHGATALSHLIHRRAISCRELMQATLDRIGRINPHSLALVSLRDADALLREADERDRQLAQGESLGWLHGIPQAIKDLANAAGLPNTMGSPLMRDFVPAEDGLMTQRMKAAGCIVIGKTNVPEFGLGSHSFNEVFGTTRNAWDSSRSAGGSSGGAGAALAHRLLSVADGSDFMGSLRNPAAWANVFGLRPSQGRVPQWPAQDVWLSQLGTEGPMGRHVRDVRSLLHTQAGRDARSALSIDQTLREGDSSFDARRVRIGWLGDLDGYLPMEDGLLDQCELALGRLRDLGCEIEPVRLGYPPERVWEAWLVWRAVLVAGRITPFLLKPDNRALIKPEAMWEYDSAHGFGDPARAVTAPKFMAASVTRTSFYQHMVGMLSRYDALALPVTQVWPFDATERWPKDIGGRSMDTYHRWMEVVIYATFAGLPAISVPAGFGGPGPLPLPAGLQLIGRPHGDDALLDLAQAYEATIADMLARVPPDPSVHAS